jgi:hypothetical protein
MALINLFLCLLFLIYIPKGSYQEDQLQINLRKNWGYSSGTGKMQGTFTIQANGPEELSRVIFYLDEQVLGEANEIPFNLQFSTDNFPLGVHQFSAIGYTSSEGQLTSNILQVEFVTPNEGWQAAMKIIVPLAVLILGALGLAILVPLIFTRGKKEQLPLGAPRNYGYHGGAICPKCGRPFSRHIYGLNLGMHKFDRCPYCGKWSLVRRASNEELAAAEAAEVKAAQEGAFQPTRSERENLIKELEDSRYEDL